MSRVSGMDRMDFQEMENNADKAAAFLSGMANPHRLRILCRLSDGEKSVSELIRATGIAQTSMSQHLNKLKDENIVSFRRDHRTLYYFIDNPLVSRIMRVMHGDYCTGKKALE